MIQTIIVDDEFLSRVGIKSLIDGKDNVNVCGIFSSAQEAMDFLEKTKVDIVLTDIEMAGTDGLDLISRIRENDLAEGVIIISCHNDFSYAREAITRGTDAYLLKATLDQKQLLAEIKRVYEKKCSTHVSTITSAPIALMDGEKGPEIYQIAVLHFSESIGRKEEQMLAGILEEIVRRYHMGTLFVPRRRDMFLVFSYDPVLSETERVEKLQGNLRILRKNVQQYSERKLSIGLSGYFENLTDVHTYYEKASEDLRANDMKTTSDLFPAYVYMEEHLDEPITLEEMAGLCCMSIPTFCRKLKDETGHPMTRFLNEKRIERAKALLQENEPLSTIAEQTGFSNENYLSRVFKDVTGMKISEYRKMIQE